MKCEETSLKVFGEENSRPKTSKCKDLGRAMSLVCLKSSKGAPVATGWSSDKVEIDKGQIMETC